VTLSGSATPSRSYEICGVVSEDKKPRLVVHCEVQRVRLDANETWLCMSETYIDTRRAYATMDDNMSAPTMFAEVSSDKPF
jgi:hypothetical protein